MVIKILCLTIYVSSISLLMASFYWHQKFKTLLGSGRIYAIEKANIKFKGAFFIGMGGLFLVMYLQYLN